MKKIKQIFTMFSILLFSCSSVFSMDLSGSNLSGLYPWEGTPVYEQIAQISIPADSFNSQIMELLMQTSLAEMMIVPMEMRPFLVSALAGITIDKNFSNEWEAVKGAPNPVMSPVFQALYHVLTGDAELSMNTASSLSAIPLMMPDSSGSAVLELRNKIYDPFFLDHGGIRAFALPWKIGFWTDGDYLNVNIVNPQAVVECFFADLPEDSRKNLMIYARHIKDSMKQIVFDSLSALFPAGAVVPYPQAMPPYLSEDINFSSPFYMDIGIIKGVSNPEKALVNTDTEGESLVTVQNSMMQMQVAPSPDNPDMTAIMNPPLFQTYSAFDGMAAFLTSAYENQTDMQQWIVRPDGNVADDFIFLAAKTWPYSPIYNQDELDFYRPILTEMFKMTFLRPRGDQILSYKNSDGNVKAYVMEIGSPYYGQILLRMGAHRSGGTPCKLVAVPDGENLEIYGIDTEFMFKYFFGDTAPETVTDWDGAFYWPTGMTLETMGSEASVIYGGYIAAAIYGLGLSGTYSVELTQEGGMYLEQLMSMAQ